MVREYQNTVKLRLAKIAYTNTIFFLKKNKYVLLMLKVPLIRVTLFEQERSLCRATPAVARDLSPWFLRSPTMMRVF